ncbi:MAG: peptidase domain-containing ABC transporter [Agitococcus sp.]|nr:peptidase domain-containing ABC transporter [Agitococcus sp.]
MKTWIQKLFGEKTVDNLLTLEQAHWLVGGMASAFKLALQRPQVDAALGGVPSLDAVFALLAEAGLQHRVVAMAEITTDTLSLGPVVQRASEGLALILASSEEGWLIAREGATGTETVKMLPSPASYVQVMRVVNSEEGQEEAFGWRWFSKEFFADRPVIRDVLLGSFFIQLIALVFPLATQAIVDKVIANQATSTLIVLGVGIFMMALFSAGLTWLRQYFLLRLSNALDKRLSYKVLTHLFRLPIQFFEQKPTGAIVNRVHVIEPIREFVAGAFILAAIDLPFMLVFAVLMVSYSWQMSLVVLAFLFIMLLTSFMVGPRLRVHAKRSAQLGAQVQGFLTEQVAAAETIKSLQLENSVQRRFAEMNQAYLQTTLTLRELANRYGTFMNFMEQTMNAAVLCLGAYLAMQGAVLTIGMLVAFQMFAQRVAQPLLKLSGVWQQFQQIRISVGQLGDIMNVSTEAYSPLITSLAPVRGHFKVENLSFRYGPQSPLLYENLSFEVQPGQVLLITGPSGSGKSTLTKVAQGLYAPAGGLVRMDGRDIRAMAVTELRSYLGVVPQESVLFSGTILDNLLESAPRADFKQVAEACQLAGIHDAIEALPKGYQSTIGERGTGLSGGQRQRLAIARALLRSPRVLLFDESTSGLDAVAEEHVAQAVNRLRGKVTILFIAHKVPAALIVDAHVQL